MHSSVRDPKPSGQFFLNHPPQWQEGWVQLQTRERPESLERELPRPTGTEHPPTKASVAQINSRTTVHTNLNNVIKIQECMLVNHIACQSVGHLYIPRAPLAGRLIQYLQNWQIITQDRWVLNTVQDYQIEMISEPWQVSLPTAPHLSTEQLQLI